MAAVEGPLQSLDAAVEGAGMGQPDLLGGGAGASKTTAGRESCALRQLGGGNLHPWSDLDLAVIGVEHDRVQENEGWDLARTAV